MEQTPRSLETGMWTRRILLTLVMLFLAVLLIRELSFMMSAVLGSVTLYVLFRSPYRYLIRKRKTNRTVTTLLLFVVSLVVLLIPLYLTGAFLLKRIEPLIADPTPIVDALHTMNAFINRYIEFSVFSPEVIGKITSLAQTVLPYLFDSGMNLVTNLIMMYFILWFMLLRTEAFEKWLVRNSPFTVRQSYRILNCIRTGIVSNAVGIILLGIIQGAVATIGYLIFGVKDPLMWGMITGAASVIPIVGTMLAWVPLSVLMMAGGQLSMGIGLFLYGLLIVGSSDNVFRFMLQKYMASTHPLVTVLGVIAGLGMLGFWGLIYGPLILSLLMLLHNILTEPEKRKKPGNTRFS